MAKLSAAQLKALPDSMFGLPKTRQYPMPDKAHVIKAIQFFKYCKDADKPELAKNINRRAKELKMQIKVQPTSAFYKYADKAILKEATLVQEFHIGQLSPIVTLQPEVIRMNFGNGKMEDTTGPLERLSKLWGSKKSLEEKNAGTADIVTDAVHEHYEINASMLEVLENIDFMSYMQTSWPNDDNDFNLSRRLYSRDNEFYNRIQDSIKARKLDDIINQLKAMGTNTMYACAVALINYTNDLTPTEKEYIVSSIPKVRQFTLDKVMKYGPDYDDATTITWPIKWDKSNKVNVTDDDIYNVDSFINLIGSLNQICNLLDKLVAKRFGERVDVFIGDTGDLLYGADSPVTVGVKAEIDIFDYVRSNPSAGYYRKQTDKGTLDFIKIGRRIYIVSYSYINGKTYLYLLAIFDYDNDEYNKNVIAFTLGANIKMSLITRIIEIRKHAKALEASDFSDTYKGIQIDTNGNVSFLMDELESWTDKFNLCKKMLERNMRDKEYEHYKNNLCALFTLINLIYNRFNPSLMDDSQESKTALNAMEKAIVLFKDSIASISKIQPEFNFVDYYMSLHYNEKIEVFKTLDDSELKNDVTIAYRWIVAG